MIHGTRPLELDDATLRAAIAGGDQTAFRVLVHRYVRDTTMQQSRFDLVVLRALRAREVGAIYGISASTVRQHVFRARQQLRLAAQRRSDRLVDQWPANSRTDVVHGDAPRGRNG